MKKEYIVIAILTGLVFTLSIFCILFATNTIELKETNKSKNNTTKPSTTETTTTTNSIYNGFGDNDTFSYNTQSGTVDVIGYAYTKRLEDYELDSVDYVYFKIIDTKSEDFKQYVNSIKKNTFAEENAIGLGCIYEGIVAYYNDNDEEQYVYKFTKEDTNTILNSSENSPIRLKLNKIKLTYGSGTTSLCYSHMTNIEIYK